MSEFRFRRALQYILKFIAKLADYLRSDLSKDWSKEFVSFISGINGSFLTSLSGQSGGRTQSASSIAGSASASATTVNLSPGIAKFANAFQNSAVRLATALEKFEKTEEALDKLLKLGKTMLTLSSDALSPQLSDTDRATLNSRLQSTIIDFERVQKSTVETTAEEEDDFLQVATLKEVLEEAGIDPQDVTDLAQAFSRVGGRDGDIGFERFNLSGEVGLSPLAQTISTQAEAQKAVEVFDSFVRELSRDKSLLSQVQAGLEGSYQFARAGFVAADSILPQVPVLGSPEEIATELVREIKRIASPQVALAYSDLDHLLVAELLG